MISHLQVNQFHFFYFILHSQNSTFALPCNGDSEDLLGFYVPVHLFAAQCGVSAEAALKLVLPPAISAVELQDVFGVRHSFLLLALPVHVTALQLEKKWKNPNI